MQTAEENQKFPLVLRAKAALKSTLGLALLGSLLVFLALPPVGWWPLAWVAPVPWVVLSRQRLLGGTKPHLKIWLAGFALWLATIHWLIFPYPLATTFGWLALSFYLAFYLPAFVAVTRVAVQRLGISVVVAAPVAWTGLELARGHLLSGFTMASLSHTQLPWPAVLQIADCVGDYGLSGLIVFVAACLGRMVPVEEESTAPAKMAGLCDPGPAKMAGLWKLWPLVPLAAVMCAVLAYGHWQLNRDVRRLGPTVALIQGSIPPEIKGDQAHVQAVMAEYVRLTRAALQSRRDIDLLVWPETMFRAQLTLFAPDFVPPAEMTKSPAEVAAANAQYLTDFAALLQNYVQEKFPNGKMPALLLGVDAYRFTNDGTENFNSALFIDAQGKALARYDKMHPVMFGEYIPLAKWLPFLYRLTPLTGGLTPGSVAVSEKIGGVRYVPNICYETVVPHLIRQQVQQLRARGEEPDVLVNLTNDGWFRGSSELDMHLACGVLRAIEMRKPLVIAANTGISAYVNADGRVVQQAPRGVAEVVLAEVTLDSRRSVYSEWGDWWGWLCLGATLLVGVWGVIRNRIARPSWSERSI